MICLTQGKSRCSTVKVSFSRRAQRSRVSTNFTPTAACLASRLHRLGWTGYGPIQRLHLPPRAWECHVAHRPRALGKEFKNGIQKPLRSSAIQEAFRENSPHTSPAGPDVRNDNGAEAQSYAGPPRAAGSGQDTLYVPCWMSAPTSLAALVPRAQVRNSSQSAGDLPGFSTESPLYREPSESQANQNL